MEGKAAPRRRKRESALHRAIARYGDEDEHLKLVSWEKVFQKRNDFFLFGGPQKLLGVSQD